MPDVLAVDHVVSSRLLDQQFGAWVAKHFSSGLDGAKRQQLSRLAEAVSYAAGLKHSCLDLVLYPQLQDPVLDGLLDGMDTTLVQALVTEPVTPLVCTTAGQRVYLQKYYRFESDIARDLRERATASTALSAQQVQMMQVLFGRETTGQSAAAETALTRRLAVITGGPGTGKTWTAARIIALLMADNAALDVQLAAPTGKAGARMMQAMTDAFTADAGMQAYQHVLARLPEKASTLDGLLGINNRLSPKPKRDRHNPLTCDVLIVDEASMIALPMMARLLDALKPTARLVLLGDKDQLASVEAGNVMGEICHASATLGDAIAVITESRRFSAHSEVGRLALALNRGVVDFADAPQQVFRHPASPDPWQPDWLGVATTACRAREKNIVHGAGIAGILACQTHFQILCALREGPYGVRGINTMVARALAHRPDSWYSGQPVMVMQNDHIRKLYNGDTGMVLPVADDGVTVDTNGPLKACFLVEGVVKTVSQAQMPDHESCYAITVHKSQGSEYGHVLLVLPSDSNDVVTHPVLGRELAYTAVTRSRERVDVSDGAGVLEAMAARPALRMSGLGDLL